ncbi:MAG TPA: hypothetical protein VK590_06305, partial [Saprospiraceae bacterium]|nr:hypothetical protein [Saprospiraceae bacterium]
YEIGKIEAYLVTDQFEPSYVKINDNASWFPYLKQRYDFDLKDGYIDLLEFDNSNKIKLSVFESGMTNEFVARYTLNNSRIQVIADPNYIVYEFLPSPPDTIRYPFQYKFYSKKNNPDFQINYLDGDAIIGGATFPKDSIIKDWIIYNQLTPLDTVYLNRTDLVFVRE